MRNSPIAAIQSEHGRITYDGKAIKVFECTQAGEKVSELVEVDSLGSEQADQQLKEKDLGSSFLKNWPNHRHLKIDAVTPLAYFQCVWEPQA
jgi:hypothetical protein